MCEWKADEMVAVSLSLVGYIPATRVKRPPSCSHQAQFPIAGDLQKGTRWPNRLYPSMTLKLHQLLQRVFSHITSRAGTRCPGTATVVLAGTCGSQKA